MRTLREGAAPSLLDGYRPLPGVPDEMVDEAGRLRPGWAGLIAHLDAQAPEARGRDVARGVQHLADAGVFFRAYGDPTAAARDWPFSPVPIILADAEWDGIAEGLAQRADLLEAVMADLYGPNRLAGEGLIPASLIARSPEWLRPLVGVTPRGAPDGAPGRFLHFLAFDLGRGSDGRWRVLADRADAPSGAGFALETRVAATHVLPDLHRRSHVRRLAGFFRDWRDALDVLGGEGRMGLLTPGALTDTYYEQAYIARYLGLPLLEGGDLDVEGSALRVRTVRGLAPLDVLWRRMDGAWCDPLELRDGSRIGTPGLVQAVRAGQVTMVNALGAGVLETQALAAFLPAICERVMGEGLRLPQVGAWWCGSPDARARVLERAEQVTLGPALGLRNPWEAGALHAAARGAHGPTPDPGGPRGLRARIEAEGADLVAREAVTLSTTPAWDGAGLAPRPMTIRAVLARTPQGWRVMPGGFGRVGPGPDPTAVSMARGGSAADVWVVAERPTEAVSLLATPQGAALARRATRTLPARAADNLFWVGRYVERTEGLARLHRAWHARQAEGADVALLGRIGGLLDDHGVEARRAGPDGLQAALASATRSAGAVRDRFSADGWAALQDLQTTLGRMAGTARPGLDASLAMSVVLRKLSGFSGLVHENMVRAPGWQFLSLGRSLERAAMMADVLIALADPGAPAGSLDAAVEVGDSVMAHRQRYAVVATRDSVLDLLALDEENPRALRFHLSAMADRVAALAGRDPAPAVGRLGRKVADLEAAAGLNTTPSLDGAALRALRRGVLSLTDAIGEAFLH